MTATLHVLAFFVGISLVLAALLGIHDGIEWLINRRRA